MGDNLILVTPDSADPTRGILQFYGQCYDCVLGRGGVIAAAAKREGDGATPLGTWALRCVYFRADKVKKPETSLPVQVIAETDGWCDDPADPAYNQLVTLPCDSSYEEMWRKDDVYDIVVPLGYNDSPPVPDRGSAIFLHLMRPEKTPTAGCVALTLPDLYAVLSHCDSATAIYVAEK
jgi:L,D-peptidoglycan transpeptidase YkuD (ErfK/YbiS/YcfS/YnhG family)